MTTKNILRKCPDGNWYSIPEYMRDEFVNSTEAIILSESFSSEWFSTIEEFNDKFSQYLVTQLPVPQVV